ncbi:MAG TPA: hypothetical protein PLN02_03875 [Azonexus sp.]|nr:hypothetical protein [Azonexus sp.]
MTPAALKSRLREEMRKWQKLPARDKNLACAVFALILVGVYGGLLWPLTEDRAAKLEYDLQKMAVREKSSNKAAVKEFVPPPSLGGKSPREAEQELEALKRQLETLRAEVQARQGRFVPMDDSLAMNALKSGLTGLAEAGDMEVTAIEHVYERKEDKDRPPTPELILKAAQANPFQRPLVILRARASFRGLMAFLDGLQALPYIAAPVGCDIVVRVDRDAKTELPIRQWLDVQIKFVV